MAVANVTELAARHSVPVEAAQAIYQHGLNEGESRARVTSVRPRAKDIVLGLNLYREAFNRGMNLSAFLEEIDPSGEYKDGKDAFQRQLEVAHLGHAAPARYPDGVQLGHGGLQLGVQGGVGVFEALEWVPAAGALPGVAHALERGLEGCLALLLFRLRCGVHGCLT